MRNTSNSSPKAKAIRIGVLLGDLDKINKTVLKFIVLRLNLLQQTFEYEFLPLPYDKLLVSLSHKVSVDRGEIEREVPQFLTRYKNFLREEITNYECHDFPPDFFILITLTSFSDNYYVAASSIKDGMTIFALGNWERNLAPPSIIEFILMGIVGAAAMMVSPSLQNSYHFGTKGCLFDFTLYLSEVRLKVLNGFVCSSCRTALNSDGLGELADEIVYILGKEWLGKSTEPDTPAGIAAKLGYDLFITKGFQTTFWENILIIIQQEGVKQLLTLIVAVIAALLIAFLTIWLRLK